MRHLVWLVSLAVLVSACGGGTASTTTTTATTTSVSATGSTSSVTSTSAAPETTTTTPDVHPVFGDNLAWEDVWPADGATAVYNVGGTVNVDARIEYGVDFRGETLNRLVFGSDMPGASGLVVYFDRTTPWVMNVMAAEVYALSPSDAPSYVERFDGGMPFDGRHGVDEFSEFEGTLFSEYSDGSVDEFAIGYRVTTFTADGVLDVPYGTVEDLLHIGIQVGFPVVGDFAFESELWLHPELFLVRITGAPAWRDIQLVTPFS